MSKVPFKPEGYSTLNPYLVVKDPKAAIAFYQKVFGAKEVLRLETKSGDIGHCELQFGDSRIFLSGEWPEYKVVGPEKLDGSAVSFCLYVEDVDQLAALAEKEGCTIIQAVEDQFYGDRNCQFLDPFGHRWTIATHIKELPLEEVQKLAEDAFG